MKVYSLSGPSGTGKSTSALEFAYKHGIDAIIDDGLLIVHGEKRAGTSAKFEKNALTAVRRAVFEDDAHRDEVKQAIDAAQIASILLIGTSDKMTKKIAARLGIEPIDEFVYVENIRSNKEIQLAKFVRTTQGKHVMPIPVRQVEQNFFKRLIQRGREIFFKNQKIGETTIVRPDFHQEVIDISKSVYMSVLQYELKQHPIVVKGEVVKLVAAFIPQIEVAVHVQAAQVRYLPDNIKQLQQKISESFELHFGIAPEYVNVVVKSMK